MGRLDRHYRKVNRAIEAFEREFAPWALKLPAADVAARRNGQLRVNGWSVLYEFGADAYGDYLDYYAALRGATDARVNDDWHARIYETGQIVAFPAVLEAYLYGRDPSPEELERAREPVLASLAPAAPEGEEGAAAIGTADTALWEDLRDVVEAEVSGVAPSEPSGFELLQGVELPQNMEPPANIDLPRRVSAETPAEIASVLDAAFGDIGLGPKKAPIEQVQRPTGEQAPIERQSGASAAAPMSAAPSATAQPKVVAEAPKPAVVAKPAAVVQPPPTKPQPAKATAAKAEPPAPKADVAPVVKQVEAKKEPEEPPASEEPAPPRRSVPGYDPFVELRTLEPKSARRAAPIGDDFRPYWQRYPARAAGIAAAVAAVLVIAVMLMGRGGKKPARGALADTASAASGQSTTPADTAAAGQPDAQPVASPDDTSDTTTTAAPAPAAVATPSTGSESSVARPVGPGSIAPIVRTDGSAASPTTSHRFAHPSGS